MKRTLLLRPGVLWLGAIILSLAACTTSRPVGLPVAATIVSDTPAATASTVTRPAISATGTPVQAAAPTRRPGLSTLTGNLPQPDDLVLAPDGTMYVSDVTEGTVRQISADGQTTVLVSGLAEPEGIVFLPGGELIIAEQRLNRLVRHDPATHKVTPFLSLPNSTGQAGVDGIALDTHTPGRPSLIIPDSPHGTLLRVGVDGKQVQTIARGFVRPVAAWVETNGSILVADEFGNRLERLHPDGARSTLATLPQPDDVVEDASGHIYVNTLVDGAVHEIDAVTGSDRILARGLLTPQGIAFDAQGALLVADPGHHRIVRVAVP